MSGRAPAPPDGKQPPVPRPPPRLNPHNPRHRPEPPGRHRVPIRRWPFWKARRSARLLWGRPGLMPQPPARPPPLPPAWPPGPSARLPAVMSAIKSATKSPARWACRPSPPRGARPPGSGTRLLTRIKAPGYGARWAASCWGPSWRWPPARL